MMGGALGLAVLASIAASRTDSLRAAGDGALEALVGGYHVAFLIGAGFAIFAALIATRLRVAAFDAGGGHAPAVDGEPDAELAVV